jgi:origin recognition complex subunit 1
LYNLFNWPTLPNSRLIVIAIANTMNLADMLPNKIQSRVGKIHPLPQMPLWSCFCRLISGLTRVNFEPYTAAQLIQIIESRLKDVPGSIVEKDAIRLCATRIANNTGDARKALDVCRRAVEMAEKAAEDESPMTPSKRPCPREMDWKAGKVTTELINIVLQEFLRHPIQKALQALPFASKVFLAALLLQTRRSSGKDEVTFGDVLQEATTLCQSSVNNTEAKVLMRGNVTTPRGLENAGVELEMCKIIDWEEKGGRRGGRVGLQISEDDLKMAFREDQGWREMVKS